MKITLLAIVFFASFSNLNHATGQEYVVDGLTNVVFLDTYNPVVVVDIGGDFVAELLSSDILVYSGDSGSQMDQVVVFQSSHNNPCGYFWALTIGEPIQLREGQVVKIFVPRLSNGMSGSATVRIGSEVVAVAITSPAV